MHWTFCRDALAASYLLFFGSVLVGLLFVAILPRVLSLAIKPNKVYRLYGLHYWLHRAIARNCLLGTKVMVPLDGKVRERARMSCATASPPRTGTRSSPWRCTWWCGGSTSS
jgi:hypothetical protein